jgi:hypothetical protein
MAGRIYLGCRNFPAHCVKGVNAEHHASRRPASQPHHIALVKMQEPAHRVEPRTSALQGSPVKAGASRVDILRVNRRQLLRGVAKTWSDYAAFRMTSGRLRRPSRSAALTSATR